MPQAVKLLIVDDEQAQMTALCQTLADEGYETKGSTSSQAALELLRDSEFDIVLTDLMMPHMDGISFLTACKEIDPNVVGIVMTGHSAVDTAVQAMQAGALDYIQKPFKLRQILPVLARAVTVRRLRLANAALERHVRQRTQQLEDTNRELEAFSYTVSHDLRAPLRVITGFTDFLNKEYAEHLPQEARKAIEAMEGAGKRMNELIDDLLRLAQVGQQALALSEIRTTDFVREILNELQQTELGRRVVVDIHDLPDCRADPSLLKQVFINLLSNAFKFSSQRDAPHVLIAGYGKGEEIFFSIDDNGAGFDMAEAPRLFGVFQRLHAQDQFEGTGIGLSIVKRIVSKHGGRVWAASEKNKGATFCFTLPR